MAISSSNRGSGHAGGGAVGQGRCPCCRQAVAIDGLYSNGVINRMVNQQVRVARPVCGLTRLTLPHTASALPE